MSYQKIPGINTGRIERGDCSERWDLIKNELPKEGIVLDIGTAEGYFLKQIAEHTNLLAIGCEKQINRVNFQKKWLTDEHKGKVISCHCGIEKDFTKLIASTCEWIDCTLLLSVLHWINSDEVLKNISNISGKIIVEIPKLEDKKATGQTFMNRIRKYGSEKEYFEQVTGRQVRLLGEVKAHTHTTRNVWVIEGDLEKKPVKPHVNYSGKKAHYTLKYTDNKLSFVKHNEKQKWTPGINLATLQHMNVQFPDNKWWKEQTIKSMDRLDMDKIKGDLRIHNLIISRDKCTWIDLDHHGHKQTVLNDIENIGINE